MAGQRCCHGCRDRGDAILAAHLCLVDQRDGVSLVVTDFTVSRARRAAARRHRLTSFRRAAAAIPPLPFRSWGGRLLGVLAVTAAVATVAGAEAPSRLPAVPAASGRAPPRAEHR